MTHATPNPPRLPAADVRQLLPRERVLAHDELRVLAPRAAPFLVAVTAGSTALRKGAARPPPVSAAAAADGAQQPPPPLLPSDVQLAGRARLDAAVAFFAAYKKADPRDASEPSPVSLEYGGRFVDALTATAVIAQGYQHWCALVIGAMRRAQQRTDGRALARAREHAVRCKSALQLKRLGAGGGAEQEARGAAGATALPPSDEIWV